MADKERAPRRSRKEKITDDIAKIETKIEEYANKISELEDKKESLITELEEINEAAKKAAEEAEMKSLVSLMKENNMTIDEVKKLIESRE